MACLIAEKLHYRKNWKKNILRYNDRIRSYQMNLLTVIITLLAPLR